MKTFRDKYFWNEMHSLDAYYNCILSCEIDPSSGSWQGVEENCEEKCMHHLDEILEMMNKRIEAEYFLEQVRVLEEVGIHCSISVVFGYPIETAQTIKETFDMCIVLYPSNYCDPLSVGYPQQDDVDGSRRDEEIHPEKKNY